MRATVGTKILGSFGLVVACALGLAAYGLVRDLEMESTLTRLHDRALVATRLAGDAGRLAAIIRAQHFEHAATTDPRRLQEIEREIELRDPELDAALDELEGVLVANDTRAARMRRVRSMLAEWRRNRTERFLPVSREQDAAAAMAALDRHVTGYFTRATQEIDGLIDDTRRRATADYEAAAHNLERARMWTLGGGLFLALLAVLLGVILARDIGRRVQSIGGTARRVADGELSVRTSVRGSDEIADMAVAFDTMASTIERKVQAESEAAERQRAEREALARAVARYGEFVAAVARGELDATLDETLDTPALATLGRDLRSMGEALRRMIVRIHETVGALSSSTAELTATAQEQSASAAQAAAAVTETVTTVDELTQTSRASAERARDVAEAARRSVDASDSGRVAVEESVAAMERVQAQMSAIAERILGLSEQAQRVGHIVSTVGDLAEQSNLLALNAAIEAARAGEHGKSFAVVAQEVRALAEQSKKATVQVRDILGEIERSTTQAVLVTEQGSKAVVEAVGTAREAGGRIDQLSHVIADSAGAASHIATTSEQQVTGVSQIAQAMHSINQASTQSVEATRQTERAARALASLSDRLREAIAQYRL